MIKVYQLYLIRSMENFIICITYFFSLAIILNIFEEVLFKDVDVNNLYPIFLTLLTAPSIVYETFPFIFLYRHNFFH